MYKYQLLLNPHVVGRFFPRKIVFFPHGSYFFFSKKKKCRTLQICTIKEKRKRKNKKTTPSNQSKVVCTYVYVCTIHILTSGRQDGSWLGKGGGMKKKTFFFFKIFLFRFLSCYAAYYQLMRLIIKPTHNNNNQKTGKSKKKIKNFFFPRCYVSAWWREAWSIYV